MKPGVIKGKSEARVIYQSPWHVWVDARYTANDDKRVSSFEGRQTNVTGGIQLSANRILPYVYTLACICTPSNFAVTHSDAT